MPLPEPTRSGEPLWLEPYPDALLGDLPDAAPGPEARYEARESVSLAFVTALQHLPPRQRAALVLRDVLGFRATETADILGCTVDAANNLLKRARATIAGHLPPGGRDQAPLPGSAREQQVTSRFADAFERGDVAAIVALLTDDAWLTMPPLPFEYQGRDLIGHFLYAVSFRHGTRRSRLIPTRANGQPAFGQLPAATRTPRSATRTACSSSPSPTTASAPSPASPTTACLRGSGSPARSPNRPSAGAGHHDAASSRARSSASRQRDAAATFSSRWRELPVPGMTRTLGAWWRVGQADLGGSRVVALGDLEQLR